MADVGAWTGWVLHPRRRWRAWWAERLAPAERTTLTQRNVYIVPTRAGALFGVTVTVLLVASMNYQLSLGFALTFLLAGSALASMHMTHGSLRGLTLHARPLAPAFAGDNAALEVVVTNPGATRHGLGFALDTGQRPLPLAYDEISAQGQASIHLAWPVPARGLHPVPVLRVESRFPFGLFRAWTLWRPAGRVVVFPQPEQPAPPWPEQAADPGDEQAARAAAGVEFDGVRAYRRGDPLRLVVWRKAARTGELVSREGEQGRRRAVWLDWSQAPLPDPEQRLSRLCAWVLAADHAGARYGLRLPGREIAPGDGPGQRQDALRALAEWGA